MQQAPLGGEKHGPVAPLEQCHAQGLLQLADLPADGAVGDVQPLGGLGKAAGLGGSIEIAQRRQGDAREQGICRAKHDENARIKGRKNRFSSTLGLQILRAFASLEELPCRQA